MIDTSTDGDILQADGQGATEQQRNLIKHLSDLSAAIIDAINKRYEPVEKIREFNNILNYNFDEVLAGLQALDKKDKLDFYKKALKGIADKVLAEKGINDSAVSGHKCIFTYIVSDRYLPILPYYLGKVLHGRVDRGDHCRDSSRTLQPGRPSLYDGSLVRAAQEGTLHRRQ